LCCSGAAGLVFDAALGLMFVALRDLHCTLSHCNLLGGTYGWPE
jgi:hypothetical protein